MNRYKLYAALLSLVMVPTLHAQYVYVDFNDTTLSTNNATYDINFNEDSLADFRITLYRDTGVTGLIQHIILSPLDSVNNKASGSVRNGLNYVDCMGVGDWIDSYSPWDGMNSASHFGTIDYWFDTVQDPHSQWMSHGTDGFIGLQTKVRDTAQYGWVRIQIDSDGKEITILDAGYQEKVDSAAKAGHIWIGLPEWSTWTGDWAWHGSQLNLSKSGQGAATIQVFDVLGRSLYRGHWVGQHHEIFGVKPRSGMVIIRVESERGRWIERIPVSQ